MNLLLASTSTVHGNPYLGYFDGALEEFFSGVKELIFIPYARPGGITHDEYTQKAAERFLELGIKTKGLHEYDDVQSAIENAEAIFTGGGNTFVLVDKLYEMMLHNTIKKSVEGGCKYMGTSAGTNIAGITINNTNDMPIVYPPGFLGLDLVPFNFNPHYLDPDPTSTHKGETRETRIKEFHSKSDIPVLGIREGTWIEGNDDGLFLRGEHTARVFKGSIAPYEINTGTKLEFYK
ncbi:MAG: dipeptidase PepE [Candidatus Kapaibacteriales bacterium]